MQADSVVHMDDKQLALSVAAVCNALLRSVSTSISIDWSEDEFGNLLCRLSGYEFVYYRFFESSAQSPVAQKIRETEQAAIEQAEKGTEEGCRRTTGIGRTETKTGKSGP